MTIQVNIKTTVNVGACVQPGCGMYYALTAEQENQYRRTHARFYCPNGHSLSWEEETPEEKAKRERDAAEAQVTHLRDQLAAERKAHAATKGQVTKARKRAEAALCPVPGCKRSFVQLDRHLASKHPEWHQHAESAS